MSDAPYFTTSLGSLHKDDAVVWLGSLPADSVRLIIADPPYDLGKAAWDTFPSRDAYLDWSEAWIEQAHRALLPDGTLYVYGFPEPLAAIAARVAARFTSHRILVWYYRNKASMHDDWGRSHESILHLRKGRTMVFNTDDVRIPYNQHTNRYPERPQAETSQYGGKQKAERPLWTPHPDGARPRDVLEVPTLCNGSREKTHHPTQKPEELIRKLVLASSNPGELVVDPFAGSGTTLAVCEETGRKWLGCEQDASYCALIADRLKQPDNFRAAQAAESSTDRSHRRSRLRGDV